MADRADSRAVLLTGSEPLLRVERLRELRAIAGEEGLDLVEVAGPQVRATEILDALRTLPFFSEKKVVIVRNAERIPKGEKETLAAGIADLPEHALLIFVDEPTDEEKALPKSDALYKALKKHGRVETLTLGKGEAQKEIAKRAKALGVEITPEALQAILEMTSEQVTEATSELEKCALFVGEGGKITPEVVSDVATPSREFRVFQLLDAICAGQTGQALATLQDLLVEGKKPEEAALRNVFPMLYRQLRLLFQARLVVERLSQEELSRCYPSRYSWAEVSSQWQRDKFLRLARGLTLEQISAMFERLVQADAELKGALPALNGRETLERFVASLCALAQRTASSGVIR